VNEDQTNQVFQQLGRMEGKIDGLNEKIEKIDARLLPVERKVGFASTLLSVLVTPLTGIWNYFHK
jgi:hypothetical protein